MTPNRTEFMTLMPNPPPAVVISIAPDGTVPIAPSGTAREVFAATHATFTKAGTTEWNAGVLPGAVAYVAVQRVEDRVSRLEKRATAHDICIFILTILLGIAALVIKGRP